MAHYWNIAWSYIAVGCNFAPRVYGSLAVVPISFATINRRMSVRTCSAARHDGLLLGIIARRTPASHALVSLAALWHGD
jgi:hypothetical protein